MVPEAGAILRVDGATSWQSIANNHEGSVWDKYNVKVEIGSLVNPNKNPEAEVAVKECEKEILKFNPDLKHISPLELAQVMKQINTRVRTAKKFAPQEMAFSREMTLNKNLDMSDSDLTDTIKTARQTAHDRVQPSPPNTSLKEGDLVMFRQDLSKHHARETHVVVESKDNQVKVKKLHNQLRQRTYDTPSQTLVKIPQKLPDLPNPKEDIPVPTPTTNRAGRPLRQAAKTASRAWADINCLRCSTNHKVGWCPDDQQEESYDYFQLPTFPPLHQPLINPPEEGAAAVNLDHQPRPRLQRPDSPRPPVITRTQSPTVITITKNPNFKPTPRKSNRIASIPKTDYAILNSKGRVSQ